MLNSRPQQTIARPVSVTGFGFWSGEDVRLEFRPAAADSGIVFVRDDLGPQARVPVHHSHRVDVPRRTNLACNGVRVEMVEHVLAAIAGLKIDNCEIGVDQPEMPGCNGSSLPFVQAIDEAGIVEQMAIVSPLEVTETVRMAIGGAWIEAQPHTGGGCSVEFRVDYPRDSVIGQQVACVELTPESFRHDLAPCRTFVLKSEADALLRRGLGTRVSPKDLLVFDDNGPIQNSLLYSNECARHKALDVVGDMALVGREISAHIVAYRSGHHLNAALAAELATRFAHAEPLPAVA